MSEDFRDILEALVASEMRFLVVGAHALAAHGLPRLTRDLAIWVEATPENAQRVWVALAEFGATLDTLKINRSDLVTPDQVAHFGVPPYRIDILTSISGMSFSEAWNERTQGEVFGVLVPIIGRTAFIRNKRASGRSKDLNDIASLEGDG